MPYKTDTNNLTSLINAIIRENSYPRGTELSVQEKEALIIKLKKLNNTSDNFDEILRIINAFYKDRIARRLKSIDVNSSLIFEMLQHEVVSATRLHALLLDLAKQENFSAKGIEKINHYFAETNDYGNNSDYITMSSLDVIDAIKRAKSGYLKSTSRISPHKQETHIHRAPKCTNTKEQSNKIIRLSDY
ncbi:hypothetical protein PT281_00320 [Lactobacillus sp. ESL0701]|uniref:hypothetical protein n=1 Tax=Lactobacillus sp. ESL0701 TaxID=2983217 RepID=UPI0023F63107|nr:hypothetical protein [Lactobacillus sp. ESL0701]MDF7671729.1 hypothetical protein [Lactobacillus sp. ESL0701]